MLPCAGCTPKGSASRSTISGTGFASLSTLKHCPLNRLKIDRSFVSELGTAGTIGGAADRGSVAIIDAMVALGRGLGLSATAEGVETPERAVFVAFRGCDEGQGILFGRPAPSASLAGLSAHDATAPTPCADG